MKEPLGQALQDCEAAVPPEALPYVPGGHSPRQALAPGVAWKVPREHREQEGAPKAEEKVPGGQGKGAGAPRGQYWPMGHKTGSPPPQEKPEGQVLQVRLRMRWLELSPIKRVPLASTAMPLGA